YEVSELASSHNSEPQNAELLIKDGNAEIKQHADGFVFDPQSVGNQVESALELLSTTPFFIEGKVELAEIRSEDLRPALKNSDQMIGVNLTLRFSDKEFSPTRT